MITKLSQSIAFYFFKEGIIEENEIDLYRYGFESIFCGLFDVGIVLIVGALFERMLYAIWYYVIFCILRRVSDGYHAKTFGSCKTLMLIMMCAVMAISSSGVAVNFRFIILSVGILSIIIRKVVVKCNKLLYLSCYFGLELILLYWKKELAIITMCAFFIVAIAAYVKVKQDNAEDKIDGLQ